MTMLRSASAPTAGPMPKIRHIDESDLNWALAEGWKDFKAKRGDLIFLALIYPIVGLIAAAVSFNSQLLPMFFPLVAGLSILGPAVASGFYELARRREAGLDSNWLHFLDPLRGRSRTPLALLTIMQVILFVGWLAIASLIYGATIGGDHPADVSAFFGRLFTSPQGWTLIVVGNLAGFAFAVATVVLTLVSFPMIVDKPVDAGTAVMTSVHAVTENPKIAAAWGLRIAGLLALGALPMFVGLAVVLPVLGYATWHLYTRLVERRTA